MSQQYYDRGAPYGQPSYDAASSPGRRPPPGNHGPSGRPRGPPPMKPGYYNNGYPDQRPPTRPPPQQYAPQRPEEPLESLYDGSAYGGAEYEQPEQWPLPSRPFAQTGRSNSPGGSPRRPPQRPQRPDLQEPILDPPRSGRPSGHIAPADRSYRPPPPQPSHHGSGHWTGDGYRSPQASVPPLNPTRPPPPPPQSSHIPTLEHQMQMPAPLQAAVYGQRNQRPPLGPPPSSRRGPASYYPQIAPVHPIAEETDSMRGSIRNASVAFDPAHSSYASSNAIPIGIPGHYVQDRGSARSLPYHGRPSTEGYRPSMDVYEEPSFEATYETAREGERGDRESPSPEPAALIRQASLGKKSKPTLTTVKSGERLRKDNDERQRKESHAQALASLPSQQREIPAPKSNLPVPDKEIDAPRTSFSDSSSDYEVEPEKFRYGDKALEATGVAALGATAPAVAATAGSNDSRNRSPLSDMLSTGTGLLDASSSESEQEVRRKRSKEQLKANLAKEQQQQRSKPRSPLAPLDSRVEGILGGALSPSDSEQLKTPLSASERNAGLRRPPRLDMGAVKEAEARGSVTSLPDLIKRATKLASNLDRGKTASRLGMNFFTDGSESDQERWRGLGVNDNRRSGSISDILASFPPPGLATTPGSRDGARRSFTNWSSNLRHTALPSDSDAGLRKRKRRCCGMPLWAFVLLLLVLFLLVAAAVVVPVVLLIVIPNSRAGGSGTTNAALASCQRKLSCQNGGANIIGSDGLCQCLCVNGYTGKTCGSQSEVGCTTISVGSMADATVGNDIPRLLAGAEGNFSISLDKQTLLGLFSSADLSCNSENALVTFNNLGKRRAANLDTGAPTPTLVEREEASTTRGSSVATSNGIVYQSGTPNPQTGSSSSAVTLDFARVAVLYIFQESRDVSTASTANENLQAYFSTGETSSTGNKIDPRNVDVGNGYSCNLPARTVDLGHGRDRGGGG